jgi:hypothetical protein
MVRSFKILIVRFDLRLREPKIFVRFRLISQDHTSDFLTWEYKKQQFIFRRVGEFQEKCQKIILLAFFKRYKERFGI